MNLKLILQRQPRPSMVLLSGGLGNQLFQIAAAINSSPDKILQLNTVLVANSDPILQVINQINQVQDKVGLQVRDCNSNKINFFQNKFYNFCLRVSSHGMRRSLFTFWIEILIQVSARIFFPGYKNYVIPVQLGGRLIRNLSGSSTLYMGYFQSSEWVGDAKDLFSDVFNQITDDTPILLNLKSPLSDALMIHIRRGDYSSEKRIGMLSSNYFHRAIYAAFEYSNFSKIVVFSNQVPCPIDFVPHIFHERLIDMEKLHLSPLEILLVMRMSKGAILSNSTLSWWAAQTNEKASKYIFAPNPWFLIEPSPSGILLRSWNLIDSIFE